MNAADIRRRYGEPPEHCSCGWRGTNSMLKRGQTFEVGHPKNAHLRAAELGGRPSESATAYLTNYQACPNCGRWLYADGLPV